MATIKEALSREALDQITQKRAEPGAEFSDAELRMRDELAKECKDGFTEAWTRYETVFNTLGGNKPGEAVKVVLGEYVRPDTSVGIVTARINHGNNIHVVSVSGKPTEYFGTTFFFAQNSKDSTQPESATVHREMLWVPDFSPESLFEGNSHESTVTAINEMVKNADSTLDEIVRAACDPGLNPDLAERAQALVSHATSEV